MKKKEDIYWVYIKWLSIPKAERQPPNKKTFAEKFDLLPADLFAFQEEKTFADDLNKETMKWAKRKTPEMLHVLYDKYQDTKNPQDLKVWQDAIKEHNDSQVETSLEDLIAEYEISENQLCALAYRILAVYDPQGILKDEMTTISRKRKKLTEEQI